MLDHRTGNARGREELCAPLAPCARPGCVGLRGLCCGVRGQPRRSQARACTSTWKPRPAHALSSSIRAMPIAEYAPPRAVLAVSATTSRSAGSGLSSQQTGTSWAVRALLWWHGTSTSNGWRCASCGSGTWRRLSTPREAVRPRCRDVSQVPPASGQWLPAGFQVLRLSCNDCKGGRANGGAPSRMPTASSAACPMTR